MIRIVDVHFPDLKRDLLREALATFFKIREAPGLKKKPTTSELLDWIKLLVAEDVPAEVAQLNQMLMHGSLSSAASAVIATAATAQSTKTPTAAAATAAYLILTSGQYQVER